jgi:Tfp pilus assembly protein PilO
MDKEQNLSNPIPSPNATRWLYLLLGVFALLIIGLSIWLISTKSNLRVLQEEKESQRIDLQHEVDSIINAHNQTKTAYGKLADSLSIKDSIIQANAVEIKKLLNTQWEYYKIKKKLDRLQVISQGYVRQMDSLYTVNRELAEENIRIKEEFDVEKRRVAQLTQVKDDLTDIVEQAAVLRTFNLSATGFRQRGSSREVETDRYRRVEFIRICFTLAENSVIEPGNKNIYLRIAAPDGTILVQGRDDTYSFVHQGEKLQYSIMTVADYQNRNLEICLDWNKRETQDLVEGVYNIDVFHNDSQIGQTSLFLR